MRRVRTYRMGSLGRRSGIDWEGIEREYRIGMLSNRQIAANYGASEAAIRNKAKIGGWVRGETSKVRERAKQIARDAMVPRLIEPTADHLEEVANAGAQVLIRHQRTAAVLVSLTQKMAAQLEHQTDFEPDLAERIREFYEAKAAECPIQAAIYKQQCNQALHAIGLNGRSKTLVNLANAADKLATMERRAHNLEDGADNRSYEDLLAELHAQES